MSYSNKKYWKGLEELDNNPEFVESSRKEFPQHIPVQDFLTDESLNIGKDTTRRDFLKYLGFGVSAATLAACKTPVTKVIPYAFKPEEITPGIANYYASTFYDGSDYCPILIKTREGRPIFIKGNKESSLTKGNVNARVNSSVLTLYNNNRYKAPLMGGKKATWKNLDGEIKKAIDQVKSKNGKIRLLTGTIISPSLKNIIKEYSKYSGFNHIMYDEVSYSALLEANKQCFDKRVVPSYHFAKAKVIVGIGADFLSGWLNSIEYEVDYARNRNPDASWMSKHYQFEANLTITGSKADYRIPVKPSEYNLVLRELYNEVASIVGAKKFKEVKTPYSKAIKKIANLLVDNKKQSLVVSGENDLSCQIITNNLNYILGNYEGVIDFQEYSMLKQGNDEEMINLISEINSGEVDMLMVHGVDPMRTLPANAEFEKILKKVRHKISFASKPDETSKLFDYICPDNHYLESWNDYQITPSHYSLAQPAISKLFDTRSFSESLLNWMDDESESLLYIKQYWKEHVFPVSGAVNFVKFWNRSLHDGVYTSNQFNETSQDMVSINDGMVEQGFKTKHVLDTKGDYEVVFYQSEAVGSGMWSDNPLLQELPDPISKITWDNYVAINPEDGENLDLNRHIGQKMPASVIKLKIDGRETPPLPIIFQPGQKKGTLSIALGYGKPVGKMKTPTGVNMFPFMKIKNNNISFISKAFIEVLEGETYPIARTQTHHTVMGRGAVVKETTYSVYKQGDRNLYNRPITLPFHEKGKLVDKPVGELDLWEKHPIEDFGHHWGMSIDLNLCTGCGACVTACSLENNVPVVGKDEVLRGREMHWLRIDRYYSSDMNEEKAHEKGIGKIAMYSQMEIPESESPKVVHQPMMCQHCNHAGCETVCPVLATTHSNEGLNQMTYNRCIGTRYCANNCAYKVRRFNWFNYIGNKKFKEVNPSQDDLGRFVLNPDVVVRSRGVMEKCSLCVQQIQEGKLRAKKEGRPLKDQEIQTACSEACGTKAIIFGDLNQKESKVAEASKSDRAYRVIEEVGQDPNVYYQTKVKNV